MKLADRLLVHGAGAKERRLAVNLVSLGARPVQSIESKAAHIMQQSHRNHMAADSLKVSEVCFILSSILTSTWRARGVAKSESTSEQIVLAIS